MWKHTHRLCNSILFQQPLHIHRTYAVGTHQLPYWKKSGLVVNNISIYFEKLSFGNISVSKETGTIDENFNTNLNILSEIAANSLTLEPAVSLDLLNYYSMCSNQEFNKKFDPELNRKLSHGMTVMNVEQLYAASKLVMKIVNKKSRYNNLNSVKHSILHTCNTYMTGTTVNNPLKLMYICHSILGNSLAHHPIYSNFIKTRINFKQATVHEMIQIIHYIGLSQSKRKMGVAHAAVNYLVEKGSLSINLDVVDIGILCASLYKLKYNISPEFEKQIISTLRLALNEKNTDYHPLHLSAIVSMSKVLYSVGCYNEDLMQDMKHFIMSRENFTPDVVTHLISIYSNCKYFDKELIEWYDNYLLVNLQHKDAVMRFKDLQRALATFSSLNQKFSSELTNTITNFIDEYCKNPEATLLKNSLIDILFSMLVLDMVSDLACKIVFSPTYIDGISVKNTRQLSRIKTMHEAVSGRTYTAPLILPRLHITERSISMELEYRPAFKAIDNAIHWLQEKIGPQTPFHVAFLSDTIHHCSLVIDSTVQYETDSTDSTQISEQLISLLQRLNGAKVCLDINDKNTSLINVNRANGIEQLKRNILMSRGWSVCILSEKEILSFSHPQALLLFILKHVCNSCDQNKKATSLL